VRQETFIDSKKPRVLEMTKRVTIARTKKLVVLPQIQTTEAQGAGNHRRPAPMHADNADYVVTGHELCRKTTRSK